VYYTITAVDQHYNQSSFAPAVEIKKPDIIAPSQPVFSSYELKENELLLRWINSTDDDVVLHTLYRKELHDTGWQKVMDTRDKKIQQWLDKPSQTGKVYTYTLIARDSAGHESPPAIPITVFVPDKRQKEAIRQLDIEADRDKREIYINWQAGDASANVVQYELYRGEDKDAFSLYQVFAADKKSFTDKELRVNTKYKYGIRAIYRDGKFSDFKMKNISY